MSEEDKSRDRKRRRVTKENENVNESSSVIDLTSPDSSIQSAKIYDVVDLTAPPQPIQINTRRELEPRLPGPGFTPKTFDDQCQIVSCKDDRVFDDDIVIVVSDEYRRKRREEQEKQLQSSSSSAAAPEPTESQPTTSSGPQPSSSSSHTDPVPSTSTAATEPATSSSHATRSKSTSGLSNLTVATIINAANAAMESLLPYHLTSAARAGTRPATNFSSTAQQTTAQQSTTQQATAQQPTTQQPTTQPTARQPTARQPSQDGLAPGSLRNQFEEFILGPDGRTRFTCPCMVCKGQNSYLGSNTVRSHISKSGYYPPLQPLPPPNRQTQGSRPVGVVGPRPQQPGPAFPACGPPQPPLQLPRPPALQRPSPQPIPAPRQPPVYHRLYRDPNNRGGPPRYAVRGVPPTCPVYRAPPPRPPPASLNNLPAPAAPVVESDPNPLTCPVCLDTKAQIQASSRHLVSTSCGHVFCSFCIEQVAKSAKQCPQCRKKFKGRCWHPLYI